METAHDNAQQHPLLQVVASISDELDKAASFNPTFVPTTDKARAMRDLSTVITRAQGLLLSVMAASGDVADEHGAKRVGDWYASATRHDHRPSIGLDHLARSLDHNYVHLGVAVLDGRVNLDQAVVITHALDELPSEVPAEIREKAELHLIELADDFAPTPLRRFATKVLDVVAPEISDEAERKALEREEQLAAERTRLSLKPLGDGTTRISGRISDATAGRLRTYLEAFASPRRTAAETDGERIPTPRLIGLALTDLLEALPAETLPAHGGTATTVTVHLNLDQLPPASRSPASRPSRPVTPSPPPKPGVSPARPRSCPPSSTASPKSSTSAAPDDSTPPLSARPSASSTSNARPTAAPSPPPGARPTTPTPGPPAARPTSTTPPCSAAITTTAPTTPATSPNGCPTATTASPGGPGRPQSWVAPCTQRPMRNRID